MDENFKRVAGAIIAVGMMIASLWMWRRADAMTSDSLLWSMRSGAAGLAAGAQLLAIASICAGSKTRDRVMRFVGFAAAGACGVCVVSAAALSLAGR